LIRGQSLFIALEAPTQLSQNVASTSKPTVYLKRKNIDNECTEGFANETIKQKKTKAIGMRYYWIIVRTNQKKYFIS